MDWLSPAPNPNVCLTPKGTLTIDSMNSTFFDVINVSFGFFKFMIESEGFITLDYWHSIFNEIN